MGTRLLPDAVLGVVGALGVVAVAVAIRVSWGGSYWVFGAVVGVLLTGCALVRRRSEVPAALVGAAIAGGAVAVAAAAGLPREPGPVAVLALAVLVATVVRETALVPAGGVAAATLAVVAGSFAAGGTATIPVLNALGWGAAVASGLALRALDARRRAAREAVRRDERLALARELHDVVAHHVTGIVLQAQAAQLATRRAPGPVHDALAGIETAGSEALAAMRRVVGVLRDPGDAAPVTADPHDLGALLDRWAARGGPALHRRITTGDWPPEVTGTVYRVVQEALTNVSRHAPSAGSVSVSVVPGDAGLTVEVSDDAPAAPRAHRAGFGLIGMRERVESLGGTLVAGPRGRSGWTVRAVLPR